MHMKNYILGAICLLFVLVGCEKKRQGPPKLLVFSKTMAFKHASIPSGIAALEKLGQENDFVIDTTTNGELFTDENLAQYSAVVFS